MDDVVREMLHAEARQLPVRREVPRSLEGRVRRRLARNAAFVAATLGVLVFGSFAGVRALQSPTRPVPIAPAHSPSPSHARSRGVAACAASQLRAVATTDGAAGSVEGAIDVTNFSDTACTLEGTPRLTLFDDNGRRIESGVTFTSSPPGWKANAQSRPAGWPTVTLRPGDAASVRIRWSNWCPQDRAAPLWRLTVPDDGKVDVNGLDAAAPPPCNGPGQPSTIEVGPFEPRS